MLRYGLKILDELNTAEEAERLRAAPKAIPIGNGVLVSNNSSELISSGFSNPVTAADSLVNFDPSNPFWISLLGLSPVRGTSGGAP